MTALDCPAAFLRAEQEMEFVEKNRLSCLTLKDEAYPCLLYTSPWQTFAMPMAKFCQRGGKALPMGRQNPVSYTHLVADDGNVHAWVLFHLADKCPVRLAGIHLGAGTAVDLSLIHI